jgi:hypothetical protein
MKTNAFITAIAASVTIVAFTGCNKNKESAPETTPQAASESAAPAAPTTPAVPAAPAAPATPAPAAPAAPAAVSTATSATASAADTLIAQAKSFIADKKYNDALDALNKLSGMVLTPEQQTTVNDLKAQVQKLMENATGTVDAAKSLLGK